MSNLNWNIIKQTLDIDEVESALGIQVISSSGNEDIAKCPLPSHSGTDTNPSFAINRDKLAYNCFVCGGGSVAQLVMECEGLEWEDALEWFRPYTGSLVREDPVAFAQYIKRVLYLDEEQNEATMPYFKPSILDPWIDGPFDYYESRGIDEGTCRRMRLCFDANYTRRHRDGEWTGGAAIIPHWFENNLVGYQVRVVETEDNPKPMGVPRFDNTSNFPKSNTLYNYDLACAYYNSEIYVVESALTAAYVVGLGKMAVATFGASISDEQLTLLRRFDRLVLAFDNDTPGMKAQAKVTAALKRYSQVFALPPVEVEKGDLLDLNRVQAAEHMTLKMPASLYDYYTR